METDIYKAHAEAFKADTLREIENLMSKRHRREIETMQTWWFVILTFVMALCGVAILIGTQGSNKPSVFVLGACFALIVGMVIYLTIQSVAGFKVIKELRRSEIKSMTRIHLVASGIEKPRA